MQLPVEEVLVDSKEGAACLLQESIEDFELGLAVIVPHVLTIVDLFGVASDVLAFFCIYYFR